MTTYDTSLFLVAILFFVILVSLWRNRKKRFPNTIEPDSSNGGGPWDASDGGAGGGGD
ncbi:hypothetical protein MAUB1S_08326 [Mycolicibacterium aubagnense]|jgi:hypothetical protein|uniref:hypothetical protein n=1 Tax=unclassified Mesorhizobium TaxID=325217 RepID=UPI0036C243A3